MPDHFKLCSTCRKEIAFGSSYYSCSVSTCNRQRRSLFFCTLPCWDAHVPGAGHRDAWAELERAPSAAQSAAQSDAQPTPLRRTVSAVTAATGSNAEDSALNATFEKEILIVASKLKKYIKERGDMNMSAGVLEQLSSHLRHVADSAILSAQKNERKTVLERDFQFEEKDKTQH